MYARNIAMTKIKKIYLKAKPKKLSKAKVTSMFLVTIGILLILIAVWPIVSFNIFIAPKFASLQKPVPENKLEEVKEVKRGFSGEKFFSQSGTVAGASSDSSNDYTKASIWFPKKPAIKISQEDSISYSISIPKLKIKDATVIVGSDDLNKSLIQYGGTAFPGDYGNTVIFGHSVLPYFFNPKDYKTIFSTLPNLSEDDEIFIKYENITYKYIITEMHVVGPSDVSILEQRYDNSYLSLITCVPPGTYEKRLWVKAKLDKI